MVAASYVYLLTFVLSVVHAVGQSFTNFTGPGAVVCAGVDYNATPCTPLLPDTCANLPECQDVLVQPTSGFVVITLPCDCATVSDCPATCEFGTLPPVSNATVITGPGYLACPVADFNDESDCEYFGFNPTCPNLASCDLTSNATGSIDATASTIYIPLECECFEAVGCPASCEKFDGDVPTLPPLSDATLNFTGVSTVTCPVVDIARIPCEPSVADNNTAACGTCDWMFSDADIIFQPGDEFVSFPLACDCLVMLGCPGSCTFVEGVTPATPTTAAPTTTATTPTAAAPAGATPVATGTPVTSSGNMTGPVASPTAVSTPSASSPVRTNATTPTTTNASRPVSAPTTTASRTNSTSSAMLIGGSSGMWMTAVVLVISALAL
jgi:hypothetical protein